ncbi:hypothetical protein OHA72_10305 [Dactylosporangium sp. NBC_01737]|uniref:hypothetical protein n=1 Tax=Dactylosporangium sp. NBC_01737 TaxID=2975959 RepID=UPI002E0E1E2A|nr:hypothetical protein OHA72_10305 [Dactylosporangium sp. NBC_01737]
MTSMLSTATQERTHPSADVPVPADVIDVLLWRLAFDVAAEHQRGPTGDCTNLRCTGVRGVCAPAVHAQRALRMARRPLAPVRSPAVASSLPVARTAATAASELVAAHDPRPAPTVVGRAAVGRPNTGRFTDWFTSAVGAVHGRRPNQLPRRRPGAALAHAAA